MAFISINYNDGGKPNLGYESVEVSYNNLKEEKTFNSGNFVKDWYDALKFIIKDLEDVRLCHSSSVDHFIMDDAPYESAYLHCENDDVWVLKYVDHSDPNYLYTQEDIYRGIEFFVEAGTKPTWEELKNLCS